MIYELLYRFRGDFGALNVLRYTPFRAIMSVITAMLLCFLVAPWFINQLRGKQISQIIREEGPESHFSKAGTPTMGGALILVAVLVPTMLWADVKNVFVVATAGVTTKVLATSRANMATTSRSAAQAKRRKIWRPT